MEYWKVITKNFINGIILEERKVYGCLDEIIDLELGFYHTHIEIDEENNIIELYV